MQQRCHVPSTSLDQSTVPRPSFVINFRMFQRTFVVLCCIVLCQSLFASGQSEERLPLRSGGGQDRDLCNSTSGAVHRGVTFDDSSVVSSAQDCCDLCRNERRCRVWSYSIEDGRCALKEESLNLVENSDYISGSGRPRTEPRTGRVDANDVVELDECSVKEGVSYPEGIVLQKKRAKNVKKCCERCRKNFECFSWYFNRNSKKCILNYNAPAQVFRSTHSGNSLF